MKWFQRLPWEQGNARRRTGLAVLSLAFLLVLLFVLGRHGLGAALKGPGHDIELVRAVDRSIADEASGDAVKAIPENDLRKRFLEAGGVLDAELDEVGTGIVADGHFPTHGLRIDGTADDVAGDSLAGSSSESSFDQFAGGPLSARSAAGFGGPGGGFAAGVGDVGAPVAGVASGEAGRDTADTPLLRDPTDRTAHVLGRPGSDVSGANPGDGSAAGNEGLAFLPDSALTDSTDDSNVSVYPASAGSTLVGASSGPDPFSGPNDNGLTSVFAADPAPVPEPTSLILLGSGLVMVATKLRRRLARTS